MARSIHWPSSADWRARRFPTAHWCSRDPGLKSRPKRARMARWWRRLGAFRFAGGALHECVRLSPMARPRLNGRAGASVPIRFGADRDAVRPTVMPGRQGMTDMRRLMSGSAFTPMALCILVGRARYLALNERLSLPRALHGSGRFFRRSGTYRSPTGGAGGWP